MKKRRIIGWASVVVLGASAISVPFLIDGQNSVDVAFAQDGLPTWNDVEAAKSDEARGEQKIIEIKGLIAQNDQQMKQLQGEADVANRTAVESQGQLAQVDAKLKSLQEQAEKNKQNAEKTTKQAASVVSQMYRSGGINRDLELFLNADKESSKDLLERMSVMEKSAERNTKASNEALSIANSAAALSEQTKTAQEERKRLAKIAEEAADQAARNVDAMRDRQMRTEENRKVLEAQLAALQDKTVKTVAGYQERLRIEEEKRKAAEEAARKAAEEAARKAREEEERRRAAEEAARKAREEAEAKEAAARAAAQAQLDAEAQARARDEAAQAQARATQAQADAVAAGVGPAAGGSGWGRPVSGYYISCPFRCYYGHNGTDLAVSQGTPIYAAASGKVIFSGWGGMMGNAVRIKHENGLTTTYMHMVQTPSVRYGQWVNQGELIGFVGTTGNSTGPHLHFEIWNEYGTPINAEPVMANFGVPL